MLTFFKFLNFKFNFFFLADDVTLCYSMMRRRRGPLKHIKFGTNIDLSDEKK